MKATVTYLHQSGVCVQTPEHYLVFDYDGTLPEPDVNRLKKPGAAVFVSHRHYDHFSRKVLVWKKESPGLGLFLSSDIAVSHKGTRVIPRREYQEQAIKVKTLRSTDAGVAFLVKTDGCTVYHAGDLNWWHWEGEPESFNSRMKEAYCREIDSLKGEAVDIAFLPVDPRQKEQETWGFRYFMDAVGTDYVVPIHWWEDTSVLGRLQKLWEAAGWKGKLLPLSVPGQTAEVVLTEKA